MYHCSHINRPQPIGLLDCIRLPITAVYVFYRAALNAGQSSREKGMSVCLSVTRVDCDKTEERSLQIFIPYDRSFSLVF